MKKTFVDVMLELPVDATLRDFLTGHGLSMPEIDPGDEADANQTLVEVVTAWADTDARDRMVCVCHGERVGGDFERTEGRRESNRLPCGPYRAHPWHTQNGRDPRVACGK